MKCLILANGYNVPEGKANRVTHFLMEPELLSAGGNVRLTVTPRTSFGKPGRPLTSSVI